MKRTFQAPNRTTLHECSNLALMDPILTHSSFSQVALRAATGAKCSCKA